MHVIISNIPGFFFFFLFFNEAARNNNPAAVMRQEERRGSLPQCLCPCSHNLYALLNFLNDLVTAAGGGGR